MLITEKAIELFDEINKNGLEKAVSKGS